MVFYSAESSQMIFNCNYFWCKWYDVVEIKKRKHFITDDGEIGRLNELIKLWRTFFCWILPSFSPYNIDFKETLNNYSARKRITIKYWFLFFHNLYIINKIFCYKPFESLPIFFKTDYTRYNVFIIINNRGSLFAQHLVGRFDYLTKYKITERNKGKK